MTIHEEIVCGSLMLAPRVINEVLDLIQSSDFHEPRLEDTFDAILAVHVAGKPVDAISVGDEMRAAGTLKSAGGLAALHAMVSKVAVPASAAYYAAKVRDASLIRQVAATGARLTQLSETDGADADDALDVVNAARTELDTLVTVDHREVPNSVAVFQAIAALDDPPGMATPWKPLTELISGWKPGCLYIAGARPGKGKSILLVQAALDMARRGKTAIIFSLEMTKNELYHRMLASIAEVPMEDIQGRHLSSAHRERLNVAARQISRLPLVVSDLSNVSVAQAQARVRAVQRDADVGLVCFDYLGLMRPAKGSERDRRVAVDGISRGLKVLAKDLDVPVLAAAQLNRESEGRVEGRPKLSDLREAGGQEQDADVVLLLHRTDALPEEMQVIVAKNRHGRQSMFKLAFQGRFARFVEMGPL